MDCSTPGFPVLRYLLEIAQGVGNFILPSHPLLPSSLLPSVLPSIRAFSNESAVCTKWPKYWSFSFSISSANEYSGLISFMIDWFDLLAVQGTLKSLLSPTPQFRNINSSVLSFLYGPILTSIHDTGKTMALTIQTFCQQGNPSHLLIPVQQPK